jgi:hypothetical protein
MTRLTCMLHEYQNTFFILSHSVILRMKNASDKNCRENQNTHFTFNNVSSKIVVFTRYKKIMKSRQATWLWHMRITFWTPKSTYTPSECVILIALPLCLHECTSVFTVYVHCLSCFLFCSNFLCVCVCFSPPLSPWGTVYYVTCSELHSFLFIHRGNAAMYLRILWSVTYLFRCHELCSMMQSIVGVFNRWENSSLAFILLWMVISKKSIFWFTFSIVNFRSEHTIVNSRNISFILVDISL